MPTPFNLEAAKRGDKIENSSGETFKFIVHAPEANIDHRVVVLGEDGDLWTFTENGKLRDKDSVPYIFMADKPKVKKTVYLNIYEKQIFAHLTKKYAEELVLDNGGCLHIAVPAHYEVEE